MRRFVYMYQMEGHTFVYYMGKLDLRPPFKAVLPD